MDVSLDLHITDRFTSYNISELISSLLNSTRLSLRKTRQVICNFLYEVTYNFGLNMFSKLPNFIKIKSTHLEVLIWVGRG